jgi:hypothetical protein
MLQGFTGLVEYLIHTRYALARVALPHSISIKAIESIVICPETNQLILKINLNPPYKDGPRSTETISGYESIGGTGGTGEHYRSPQTLK